MIPRAVILIGPPGCGKTDPTRKLAAGEGYFTVSMSEVIKGFIENDPDRLLNEAEMSRGNLLPDPLCIAILADYLRSVPPEVNLVIDGFPRTLVQAEFIVNFLREYETFVVILELSDEECKDRVRYRKSEVPRTDDNPKVHARRLRVYREAIPAMQRFFQRHVGIHIVDASLSKEAVWQEIDELLHEETAQLKKLG